MSYTYSRAVGVLIAGTGGEINVDLTGVKTATYFNKYSKLIIVVKDSFTGNEQSVDAFNYQYDFQTYDGDIVSWLAANPTKSLITSSTLPGTALKYVSVGDVQYSNYRVNIGNHQLSQGRQATIGVGDGPDIRITHASEKKDFQDIVTKCLFTVNGHFVRALGREDAIYLKGAGKNFRINDNVHVNCLDFSKISNVDTRPFTEDMIQYVNENGCRLLNLCLNQDLTNKKVWLIIAGRLFTGSPLITRLGDSKLRVDYRHADWPSRIFESLNYIDLSDVYDKARKVIRADQLFTEDTFKAILLNENSFFVVFDNPYIGYTIEPLETYRYPTRFITSETYNHPLMLDNGLFPSYRAVDLGETKAWDVDIRFTPNYVNRLTGVNNGGNLYHAFSNRYEASDLVHGFVFKIHALK